MGEVFNEQDNLASGFFRYKNAIKCNKNKQIDLIYVAEKLGFSSVQECGENLRSLVSGSIYLLCEFCEIFVDPKTVYDLVPMLYVYWS